MKTSIYVAIFVVMTVVTIILLGLYPTKAVKKMEKGKDVLHTGKLVVLSMGVGVAAVAVAATLSYGMSSGWFGPKRTMQSYITYGI